MFKKIALEYGTNKLFIYLNLDDIGNWVNGIIRT